MSRSIFFLVGLMVAGYPVFAQSNVSVRADSDAQKRHAEYFQLNRQIFARHEDPGSGELQDAKAVAASQKLHDMISNEIERALAEPKPSEKSISSAIAALQGELTLRGWTERATNTPFAKFFSLNGVQSMAIAYVMMQGGGAVPDTQTYLDFYDNASGVWRKRATAPTLEDFEGCTFSVSQLNSGLPGEVWFLAWGMHFGSSHGTHFARLYAFDGGNVRTIWKRDELDGGRIKTTPNTVTLDYFDFDDVTIEHHEVLHVTPNGLE